MDLPLEHAQCALDIVLEDHKSQNIPIPTHASPALASLPQTKEDTPAPSPSLPTPLSPAPSPSLSLPSAVTLPVRNSRRQASGSLRSPSTIPRRMLLRARRNSGLTPFERAADLFASVERRRLRYEEARDKRLHEREIERLRLEAERIDVTRDRNNLLHQLSLLVQQLLQLLHQNVIAQQRPSS